MSDKTSDQVKDAVKARDEAVEAAQESVEVEATRADIDRKFREDVAKAAEKRDKALAKLPNAPGANLDEIAWNETKADDDPVYAALVPDFKQKLHTVTEAVRATGNADVVGLEAYEARIVELLEDEKAAAGTVTPVAAAAKANAEKGGK
jgi:hypothetical protein